MTVCLLPPPLQIGRDIIFQLWSVNQLNFSFQFSRGKSGHDGHWSWFIMVIYEMVVGR